MADETIFIGYRRDDMADHAGRIYDVLAARFGARRVFKDVDNIGFRSRDWMLGAC